MTHEVEYVRTRPATVAVVRFELDPREMATIGDRIGHAFETVVAGLGRAGVTPTGPAIACYEPGDARFGVAAGFEVPTTFVPPAGLERLDLAEVQAAHTTHLGSYASLPTAYQDLEAATAAAGRALLKDGPMWEEYWSAPGTPDERTRTEVYWPLAPADHSGGGVR